LSVGGERGTISAFEGRDRRVEKRAGFHKKKKRKGGKPLPQRRGKP